MNTTLPGRQAMSGRRATAPLRDGRWLAALALLTIGLLTTPAPARAGCGIEILEMPVTLSGTRAIATVKINGTSVPLLVDSGAFFSNLTEATAEQLKLRLRPLPNGMQVWGIAGAAQAYLTTVEHLELLNGQLDDIQFVVGGNELGEGTMGLMGRNILNFTDTEYDLAHGVIRFIAPSAECAKSNMAYWAGDTPVSEVEWVHGIRDKSPAIRAVALVNGHKTTALFDTGATTTVTLRGAHEAGVKDADMTRAGQMSGIGSGKVDAWIAPFQRFELGGETILNNHLAVGDFEFGDADMLLGIDFFLSHRLYVSKKQSKIFFTYNGGRVFFNNLSDRAAATPASPASGADMQRPDAMTADELARRGAASMARGDLAAALADLDRACLLAPDSASSFRLRASIHLALRDVDLATADLDTTLRLDPGQAEARMTRARLFARAGKREQALEDLSILDRDLPPQSSIRASMARSYDGLGELAPAVAQWNLWIASRPNDIALGAAYNSRCWLRTEMNTELTQALDDCDEAVDAEPKNAYYLDSRAWVYLRLGKLQKSVADFSRAIAIRPASPMSLYGRALAHQRLGETALATTDLAAARTLDPGIDATVARDGLPVAPPDRP